MINVYVPAPGSHVRRTIAEGSGIVGTMEDDRLLIDYEGNLYGAVNIKTFADRVDVAWGRHRVRYPTVARMLVKPEEMRHVGEYDQELGVVLVHDLPALANWISVELSEDERNPELWRAGR